MTNQQTLLTEICRTNTSEPVRRFSNVKAADCTGPGGCGPGRCSSGLGDNAIDYPKEFYA